MKLGDDRDRLVIVRELMFPTVPNDLAKSCSLSRNVSVNDLESESSKERVNTISVGLILLEKKALITMHEICCVLELLDGDLSEIQSGSY